MGLHLDLLQRQACTHAVLFSSNQELPNGSRFRKQPTLFPQINDGQNAKVIGLTGVSDMF